MKLSVFDIVREAYQFIWQERRKFWLLAMPGVIGLSILAALMEALVATWPFQSTDTVEILLR